MEKILKEILIKLNNLEIDVKGIKEEHGQMLRAILESKEVQKGEIDVITHRTAKLEGIIKSTAKLVLDDFQEVSNQS